MPFYDSDNDVFTRGEHEGKSMETVAKDAPGYLVFLADRGKIDKESIEAIEEFIEAFPEMFVGLID